MTTTTTTTTTRPNGFHKTIDGSHWRRRKLLSVSLLPMVLLFWSLQVVPCTTTTSQPNNVVSNSSLTILSAGHANVSSMAQLKRYARKYKDAPIVLAASAASLCEADVEEGSSGGGDAPKNWLRCESLHQLELAYVQLSRRLRRQRVPFLRVNLDSDKSIGERGRGGGGGRGRGGGGGELAKILRDTQTRGAAHAVYVLCVGVHAAHRS